MMAMSDKRRGLEPLATYGETDADGGRKVTDINVKEFCLFYVQL